MHGKNRKLYLLSPVSPKIGYGTLLFGKQKEVPNLIFLETYSLAKKKKDLVVNLENYSS